MDVGARFFHRKTSAMFGLSECVFDVCLSELGLDVDCMSI